VIDTRKYDQLRARATELTSASRLLRDARAAFIKALEQYDDARGNYLAMQAEVAENAKEVIDEADGLVTQVAALDAARRLDDPNTDPVPT
jgi:hypothetical protein